MTKIFLRGGSYTSQSLIAGVQRSLNLYAEEIPPLQGEPSDPRNPQAQLSSYTYYPTPGLVALGGSKKGTVAGILPISDLEASLLGVPSVGPPGALACGQQFHWSVTVPDYSDTHCTQTDQFNNFVYNNRFTGGALALRASDGAVVWSYTTTDLANDINVWLAATFGAPPIPTLHYGTQIYATPICGGQYIAMMFQPELTLAGFAYWTAIYAPSASGNPTLLGAVYFPGLLASPYLQLHMVSVAGEQTADDPIIYVGSAFVTGESRTITVLPSVNQIIDLAYNLDAFGVQHPVIVPGLIANQVLYPIATLNLTSAFYQANGGGYGNMNMVGAWFLPAPAGGTNMYCYFNRAYTTQSLNVGPNSNLELRGLQPTWPLGMVLKIRLGVVKWTNISGRTPTPTYTVDNSSWGIVGGLPVVPFRDEYRNLRLGTAGTTLDTYQMKPGIVQPIVGGALDGKWLVGMTMSGMEQFPLSAATFKYQALRVFAYDTPSESFTQFGALACPVYQYSDINGTTQLDDNEQLFYLDGSNVMMYGQTNSNGHYAYLTKFGTITFP